MPRVCRRYNIGALSARGPLHADSPSPNSNRSILNLPADTLERWWNPGAALADPTVRTIVLFIAGILALAPLVFLALEVLGPLRNPGKMRAELWTRWRSWLVLVPLMLAPALLGALPHIVFVGLLSGACFSEFARATGLFRERILTATAAFGILAVTLAVVDHWYHFFVALFPLVCALICCVALFADRPKGYIQRTALAVFGFMTFGVGFGHIGYFGNDARYRAIVILLVLAVEMNDVFAFICGKLFGRHQLCPQTSPNKTVEGAIGALLLTTALVLVLGRFVFAGTPVSAFPQLALLGLMIGGLGQLGDLLMSAIKRDLGLKDMGALIPGHGGLLDRFDSLLLSAPAVFHYLHYVIGIGEASTPRVLF